MLKPNGKSLLKSAKFSKRLPALALAGLLLLCSGCGSSDEPGPTPSQSVSTAAPTPEVTPAATPEAASSPTDVNAPVLPAPDVSVEREAPESLSFLAYKGVFTVTNAEGQTLSCDGTSASGTMEFAESNTADAAGREVFLAQIPYSGHLVCQLPEGPAQGGQWGFDVTETHRKYFTAIGEGKVKSVEYDASGELVVSGEAGLSLDLTIGMPDSSLGERGWIKLTAVSAEEEVRLEVQGSSLSFFGLDPDKPVTVSYGGLSSGSDIPLELDSGSGTLFFGSTAEMILQ